MALTLRSLIIHLRDAPRLGSDKDVPEGARYIQISDTLALQIASELEQMLVAVRNATYYEPGDFGYGYDAALTRVLDILDPDQPTKA